SRQAFVLVLSCCDAARRISAAQNAVRTPTTHVTAVLELNSSSLSLQFPHARWYGFAVCQRTPRSAMPDGADRREARRFNMTLPLRLLPTDSDSPELQAQTRDVSYRGLYFLAAAQFKLGSVIEFVITLPEQVTRSSDVNIRCHGQVVRVEPTQTGRMGIAAKIDRYEFLHAA